MAAKAGGAAEGEGAPEESADKPHANEEAEECLWPPLSGGEPLAKRARKRSEAKATGAAAEGQNAPAVAAKAPHWVVGRV